MNEARNAAHCDIDDESCSTLTKSHTCALAPMIIASCSCVCASVLLWPACETIVSHGYCDLSIMLQAPYSLTLRGFRHDVSSRDGVYHQQGYAVNGRPAYVLEGSSEASWLCYDAENRKWVVQPKADKGSTKAWCHSSVDSAAPWEKDGMKGWEKYRPSTR